MQLLILTQLMNPAIYIGVSSLTDITNIHDYAESCELYSIFAEVSRTVARKSNLNASQAVSEYLSQCSRGEHVVLKSFASFSKSTINRQCFLYNFSKIFETETNSRNGLDYYQLFRLLCSDFPKEIILNSVRLMDQDEDRNMVRLLDSRLFLNSLYINFIYSEYLESLLQKVFGGSHQAAVSLLEVYRWAKEEDLRNLRTTQKPLLAIIIQIILNQISKNNQTHTLVFLNEDTVDPYIAKSVESNSQAMISYQCLCEQLLRNQTHRSLVEKSLNVFQNNASWASEAAKLVNSKESEPQPLNTRKAKPKK